MLYSYNYNRLLKRIEKGENRYVILLGPHYALKRDDAICILNSCFSNVNVIDLLKDYLFSNKKLTKEQLIKYLSDIAPKFKTDKNLAFLFLNINDDMPLRTLLNELVQEVNCTFVAVVDGFLKRNNLQNESAFLYYPHSYRDSFLKSDEEDITLFMTCLEENTPIELSLHNHYLAVFMNHLINLANPKTINGPLLRETKADEYYTKWLQKKILGLHDYKSYKLIKSIKKSIKSTRNCLHLNMQGVRRAQYKDELDLLIYNGVLAKVDYSPIMSKNNHAFPPLLYPTNPAFYLSSLNYFDYLRFLSGEEDLVSQTTNLLLFSEILSSGHIPFYYKSHKNASPFFIIDEPEKKAVIILGMNTYGWYNTYIQELIAKSFKIYVLTFDVFKKRKGVNFIPIYMIPLILD